jgi:glucoamylase
MPRLFNEKPAFGAPGLKARWTAARKDAVGTAYSTASRVWFTLWRGILTEIYYPTVDQPQIRDLQFLITDGETFFHEEKRDLESTSESLDHCPGFKVVNKDPEGRYVLEKEIVCDPHLSCVLVHTRVIADQALLKKLKIYVLCAPHLKVGGANNNGQIAEVAGRKVLTAWKGHTWLAIGSTKPYSKLSCGFVGTSDGWTDIADNKQMDWQFDSAMDGNIALTGEILVDDGSEFTTAIAFGHGAHSAVATLLQSLDTPFDEHKAKFTDQWSRAHKTLLPLEQKSLDGGKLARASYKILLSHEDKMNPGALIASLAIPWGEVKGDEDLGGYHLVWPRDMVNSAIGLLAAGNYSTPLRALVFLAASQRTDGGFPQNFWISGDAYWSGLQLDEVSFPIILAWRLKREGLLKNFDPYEMVMRAATFLIFNGPITQQERWEENGGYSPSTLAANISSLICAAAMARTRADEKTARFFEDYADYMKCHLEQWTVTENGELHPEIKKYFVRINPITTPGGASDLDNAVIYIANRAPGSENPFKAKNIVDGGFLELVRYGILPFDDPTILNTIQVVDHILKTETPFGPSWRRYNHDGYGQGDKGEPFDGVGVGRSWPLLTGERAHYELAAGRDPNPYIKAIENFASPCGPIPEQIWDADDLPEAHLFRGRPTGSAMPLAWAHAEYLKLLRSSADGKVFDLIPEVKNRYIDNADICQLIEIWRTNWQVKSVRRGFTLRIISERPFSLHWSTNDWNEAADDACISLEGGAHYIDMEIKGDYARSLKFSFFWLDSGSWEGCDYEVAIV